MNIATGSTFGLKRLQYIREAIKVSLGHLADLFDDQGSAAGRCASNQPGVLVFLDKKAFGGG
ncbi:MAG: hypothetical protein BWX86_01896 [Verrucomicrobia bacterium ADurb.Bin122]|nr:MAG: hypothetical protein BWX86_01896 [Verrucomicrobia bacterium ADurb.Bin122]